MGNDKNNATIGLPRPGGAVFWAPAGTPVPTDADTPVSEVSAAYVSLGLVTEDGLTSTTTEETTQINAWGPEPVLDSQTSFGRNFTLNLLETSRVSALQFRHGIDNVTIGAGGEIKVNETGKPLPRGVFVVDTLQNNGGDEPRIRRQVAGDAKYNDRSGDQVFNNSDAVSIPVNVVAYKYTQEGVTADGGDYVTEYWSAPIAAEQSA